MIVTLGGDTFDGTARDAVLRSLLAWRRIAHDDMIGVQPYAFIGKRQDRCNMSVGRQLIDTLTPRRLLNPHRASLTPPRLPSNSLVSDTARAPFRQLRAPAAMGRIRNKPSPSAARRYFAVGLWTS